MSSRSLSGGVNFITKSSGFDTSDLSLLIDDICIDFSVLLFILLDFKKLWQEIIQVFTWEFSKLVKRLCNF